MNLLHVNNSDEANRDILLEYVKGRVGLFAEMHLGRGKVRLRPIGDERWGWVVGEVYLNRVESFSPEGQKLLQEAFDKLTAEPFRHGVMRLCPMDQYEPSGRQEVGLNNCFFKTETTVTHDGLRFRSPAEVALYSELKKRQVLFFPNAAAVLGGTNEKREPDFLICHQGKWGILEVMGETYHTSQNAVKDHDRARLFKQHGLLCIEFYPAARCLSEPAVVVDEFFRLLASH
jgi:hypothetical protein